MALTPTAVWPGADRVTAATYTLSLGTAPGTAAVTTAAVGTLAIDGALVITDGVNSVTLPNARLDKFVQNPERDTVTLFILDRRWRWQFPRVSGRYNYKDETGELVPQAEFTPRELATLLFTALGEIGADVSAMPDDARPEIEWDHTPAAQALDSLCDTLGCRVCYNPATDLASVVALGTGGPLPGGSIAADSPGVNLTEMPAALRVVGAVSLYQFRVPLEAVGLDKDGSLQLVDDLSYKPPAGWGQCDPPKFPAIPETAGLPVGVTRQEAMELATASVWRYYRVPDVPVNVPGYGWVYGSQITLTSGRAVVTPAPGAPPAPIPAVVGGVYWPGQVEVAALAQNTAPGTTTGRKFSVDPARRLVVMDAPTFQYTRPPIGLGVYSAADIWVECAAQLRDDPRPAWPASRSVAEADLAALDDPPDPAAVADMTDSEVYELWDELVMLYANYAAGQVAGWVRYATDQAIVGGGFGTLEVIREDVRYHATADYDGAGALTGTTDNATEAAAAAGHYLAGTLPTLGAGASQERGYNGIVPVMTDGVIHQVTWSMQVEGRVDTRAAANLEPNPYIPAYKDKRVWQTLRTEKPGGGGVRADQGAVLAGLRADRPPDPFKVDLRAVR